MKEIWREQRDTIRMIKKKGGKSLFNLTPEALPFYNSNQAIFSLVPQDEQCG